MCFSATASFSASASLALIGALSVRLATTRNLRLFACTPLIFAAQQLGEGVIWLTAAHPNSPLFIGATYYFIGIAQLLWPLWIPLVVLNLETDPHKKQLLRITQLCGALFFAYSLGYLILYGAQAETAGNHIAYTYPSYPNLTMYYLAAYLYAMAIIMPTFISSVKHMWILGVSLFASAIIAKIYYPVHFASIWCFFGAVISSAVLYVIWINRHDTSRRM